MDIINYKCPSCASPLTFSSETQNWHCTSCDSDYTLDYLKEHYSAQQIDTSSQAQKEEQKKPDNWDTYNTSSGSGDWSDNELSHMVVYSCPSCGAEIITDETTAATFCIYCQNPAVLPKQLTGQFRPDYVIPFTKSSNDAKTQFLNLCKGKKLLPKDFTSENQIEKLRGVYVPFWLYDCDVDADLRYDARTIHVTRSGNVETTRTDYFQLVRKGSISYTMVPADGSSKLDDRLMQSIEPYNYNGMVDFSLPYLSGYYAEKYDVTSDTLLPSINHRVYDTTISVFGNSVNTPYATKTLINKTVNVTKGDVKYALLPVWLLNTKYNGKLYTFAMNGQTGKMIGQLPMCKKRFCAWLFGLLLGIPAAAYIIAVIFLLLGGAL